MNRQLKGLSATLASAVFVVALPNGAAAAEPKIKTSDVVVQLAHQFVLHSKHSNRDYLIQISEPLERLKPGEKAAAIYALDGQGAFHLLTDAVRVLKTGPGMAPAYVIAIGYEDDSKGGDLRDIDYVHVKGTIRNRQIGGGGTAFEAFILDELRPLIEARYPVDPNRSVIAGHSLGGLFVTTVLANKPNAFSGYLIASPSLQFDPTLFDRVKAVAAQGAGRRVYITVGSEEGSVMVPAAQGLHAALSGNDSKFEARYCNVPGYYHMSVTLTLGSVALPFLLPPPAPAPPPARICPSATVAKPT